MSCNAINHSLRSPDVGHTTAGEIAVLDPSSVISTDSITHCHNYAKTQARVKLDNANSLLGVVV